MTAEQAGPTVVVAVDGSDHSHRALDWAVQYARGLGGSVYVIMAWEIPMGPWSATGAALDALFQGDYDFAGSARAELDELVAKWLPTDPGVPIESEVREGNPSGVVLTTAEERNADIIVLGSRGRGGFKGLFLGSTSQHVAAHAKCPVAVVR